MNGNSHSTNFNMSIIAPASLAYSIFVTAGFMSILLTVTAFVVASSWLKTIEHNPSLAISLMLQITIK